jgi:hypothetical protein
VLLSFGWNGFYALAVGYALALVIADFLIKRLLGSQQLLALLCFLPPFYTTMIDISSIVSNLAYGFLFLLAIRIFLLKTISPKEVISDPYAD